MCLPKAAIFYCKQLTIVCFQSSFVFFFWQSIQFNSWSNVCLVHTLENVFVERMLTLLTFLSCEKILCSIIELIPDIYWFCSWKTGCKPNLREKVFLEVNKEKPCNLLYHVELFRWLKCCGCGNQNRLRGLTSV